MCGTIGSGLVYEMLKQCFSHIKLIKTGRFHEVSHDYEEQLSSKDVY